MLEHEHAAPVIVELAERGLVHLLGSDAHSSRGGPARCGSRAALAALRGAARVGAAPRLDRARGARGDPARRGPRAVAPSRARAARRAPASSSMTGAAGRCRGRGAGSRPRRPRRPARASRSRSAPSRSAAAMAPEHRVAAALAEAALEPRRHDLPGALAASTARAGSPPRVITTAPAPRSSSSSARRAQPRARPPGRCTYSASSQSLILTTSGRPRARCRAAATRGRRARARRSRARRRRGCRRPRAAAGRPATGCRPRAPALDSAAAQVAENRSSSSWRDGRLAPGATRAARARRRAGRRRSSRWRRGLDEAAARPAAPRAAAAAAARLAADERAQHRVGAELAGRARHPHALTAGVDVDVVAAAPRASIVMLSSGCGPKTVTVGTAPGYPGPVRALSVVTTEADRRHAPMPPRPAPR